MARICVLSVHGSPLSRLGTHEAGGMQAYVRALSRAQGRRGHTVDVFTRRTDPTTPLIVPLADNARVISLDAGPIAAVNKNTVLDFAPEFVCNLQRFTRSEGARYDVVHSHYWLSGWVGHLIAPRWHVPQVTMFHTLGRLKNDALVAGAETDARIHAEERIVATSDWIVAASEHERQALADLYGASPERVAVIPCGVDLDLFRPVDQAAARRRLGLQGDVLLFVGRMDPIKGLDLLIRAFARLPRRPNLSLVVVGGDGGEPEFQRNQGLARELGVADRVYFRGAVPQDLLPDYYSAATVCVVPSHYESFGLSAIEGLACGTPVIASKVGGLPMVIQDRENGLLVPWRRPETLAARLAEFLDDRDLRAHLARNARNSVLRYGWDNIADAVDEVYRMAPHPEALRHRIEVV